MIEFVEGNTEFIGPNYIILNIGQIGFRVYTTLSTIDKVTLNDKVKLYTHFLVRERDFTLFGFLKREERDLFVLILNVGGIGPKIGLAILSLFTPERVKSIIMAEDVDALVRVPGIGKKTAQRMILELKGSLEKGVSGSEELSHIEDVYLGLSALGYSRSEIDRVFKKIKGEIEGITDTTEIIRLILKEMDKNG